MCQRMDETQFAVLDAEEVGIRRSAAPGGGARAERTERDDGSNRLIDHEVPVGDIDAARYANLTGIVWRSLARMHTTLGAVAGETPRHQIHFPFKKCIQVSVSGGYQRRAGVAPGGGDGAPILGGCVLQIVI